VLEAKPLGREVAGFLLGAVGASAPAGDSPSILTVADFAIVSPECQKDRLFLYSKIDPAILKRQFHACERENRCVGFFRANLRFEPGPTGDDMKLMSTHFGDSGILLLINCPGKRVSARFHSLGARHGADVRVSYPLSLDGPPPQDERLLEAGERGLAELDGNPAFERDGAAAHSTDAGRRSHRLTPTHIALILAGAVILTMGAIQIRTLRLLEQRAEPQNVSNALDLKTERSGGPNEWRLAWNRSSEAIRKAGKGRVSIRDGYLRKDIDLSAADLQTGHIVYSPVSDDVSFRLEVFDLEAGRGVSESIRVLASPWPDSPVASVYSVTPGREPNSRIPSSAEPNRGGASRDISGAGGERAGQTTQKAAGGETATAASGQARRSFTPPSSQPVVAGPGELPVPPPVQTSGVVQQSPIGGLGSWRAPAVQPPAPRPVSPAQPAPAGAVPANPGPASPSHVDPPILVHRTDPRYPSATPHLTGTVVIEATIGTDGRLHDPHVLSGPMILKNAAIAALSQWIYRPAKVNGQVVSAPTRIEMHFGPPER